MKEFIAATAEKLGVDEAVISKGMGVVLSFLKSKLGDSAFAQLAEKIPGAAALLGSRQEGGPSAGGGGMLGGLMKAASSALGGDAASALELPSGLQDAGLRIDQLAPFGASVMEMLKDKAGSETVNQIMEKVPDLKSLMG